MSFNAAQCTQCGDVIASLHTHDFKLCSCRRIGVDGGQTCRRRIFREPTDIREIDSQEEYERLKALVDVIHREVKSHEDQDRSSVSER